MFREARTIGIANRGGTSPPGSVGKPMEFQLLYPTNLDAAKTSFDDVYTRPEPTAYFKSFARLDYRIPAYTVGLLRRVLDVLGSQAHLVVDVCSSYGLNSALLNHTLRSLISTRIINVTSSRSQRAGSKRTGGSLRRAGPRRQSRSLASTCPLRRSSTRYRWGFFRTASHPTSNVMSWIEGRPGSCRAPPWLCL